MILETPENTRVLFWDAGGGLYTHIAETLAPHFKKFYYWSEYRDAFPLHYKRYVGEGLEGVTRCKNPWMVMDEVDLIIFPDVGYGGETEFLRKSYGKLVWGTGLGEVLELDREALLQTQENLGLLTPKYEVIRGVNNLRVFLQNNPDTFVKINTFRGDIETFHNETYEVSRPLLDEFLGRLGPLQDYIDFIVQFPLKGEEIGYDGSCIDGRYSQVAMWGVERKDKSYVFQVCDYNDLPPSLQATNEVFAPIFSELGVRGFFSNEIRQNSAREYVLIDPCLRAGIPPSESYLQMFSNWPEHILAGAQGEVVDFEPIGQYAVQIMLCSAFIARNKWLAVHFPDEFRNRVLLHGHCKMGGTDYSVSMDPETIAFGAVVGIGDTFERAKAEALEIAESIQAVQLELDGTGLNDFDKKIADMEKHGIKW